MSEEKTPIVIRPYAVEDALNADALPRVVIHTSNQSAVSHVVSGRFSARALSAMEVLSLVARGAHVEDPRGSLPAPPKAPPALAHDVSYLALPDAVDQSLTLPDAEFTNSDGTPYEQHVS